MSLTPVKCSLLHGYNGAIHYFIIFIMYCVSGSEESLLLYSFCGCYLKEQSLSNNAIKGHFLDRSISALITPEM